MHHSLETNTKHKYFLSLINSYFGQSCKINFQISGVTKILDCTLDPDIVLMYTAILYISHFLQHHVF